MSDIRSSVEEVFREESGRIVAALIRFSGSFDLAEEAMQDAFAAALATWPVSGIPINPAAWISTAARRKLLDEFRKRKVRREKGEEIARGYEPQFMELAEEEMPDDMLRLVFTCCHPALNTEAQIALTLRTLGGLSTAEIARAFLTGEATLAQRLTRAKTKIREANIPYEVPPAHRLAERLESVRAVLYLIFNEGYASTAGDALIRADLCGEAIRLSRMLCELVAADSENTGLLALMLLQDSRRAARTGPNGELITLEYQDRSRWNRQRIAEALGLLRGSGPWRRYEIEARIAATHAIAATAAETDWRAIAMLYGELLALAPSSVVELNRAVAIAMSEGCDAGLEAMDRIEGLGNYHLFHAARADLLRRMGRSAEAAAAYGRALELATNAVERDYLMRRLNAIGN
jgi:RNA polymerase sigma-70 factor (ECF subfamily)